jgi:hypothetical protein
MESTFNMVANPQVGFARSKFKFEIGKDRYHLGSGKALIFTMAFQDHAVRKGCGWMIDNDASLMIPCLDPPPSAMPILKLAYEREVKFGAKGKNSRDRFGSTVRSFHSSTSVLINTVGKMIVAHGTFMDVEVVFEGTKKGGRQQEVESKYGDQQREAALNYLRKHHHNGAVYLSLNADHHTEFRAWTQSEEAKQVLMSVTQENKGNWDVMRDSFKWSMESPEQMEVRIDLNRMFLKSLDKGASAMLNKAFRYGDILGRMNTLERAGKHELTDEKKQENMIAQLDETLFEHENHVPYLVFMSLQSASGF